MLAVFAAIAAQPSAAFAQATDTTDAKTLDKVTVTGSLIPQTQLENQTPIVTVTAEDIQTRGFTSVADVLQQSSLSTGGLQGGQTSASFTQGAEAAGMFGLSPGYTKYLINGRPMQAYPALYNGSDTFNNISGIPIDIVDRVEILPGGQSSLYGSDAIAGVVNIVLKERLDGGTLNVRGGSYAEGGGSSVRASVAKDFHSADDRLNVLVNVQYEHADPIWGYQRDLTRTTNAHGYTAQLPSNDFLVFNPANGNRYLMMDPALCANVAGQFGGTTVMGTRSAGRSCGSTYNPGFKTLKNGKDSAQLYSAVTYDVSDSFQVFADLLYSHEDVKYASGSNYLWWGTASGYGRFWDPASGNWMNLQRAFAPEDIGGEGYGGILDTDQSRAYQITLGGKGNAGAWDYMASFTRGEYRLSERNFVRWTKPINAWFEQHVLGPQLGTRNGFPIFSPDWAAFYAPISPVDFASFTGYATNNSKTWQNLGRVQVTNGSLFPLKGGDAGFAVVAEGGSEGWNYAPDPRILKGEVWGLTAVAGAGHRSNYALTGELRMPLLESLTVTGSARYDAFRMGSTSLNKPTYSLGIEYRPVESLLFRGKYGTAFRAPSLSDMFQGQSGYYANGATDYYRCGELGYAPTDTTGCPFGSVSVFGQRSGNPELKPITAHVWNAGIVLAPASTLSFSVDYYHWRIRNEVDTLSSDQLLLAEYYCRNQLSNNTAASCQNATDWITRDPAGALTRVYTPKLNVARQNLEAVTASAKYLLDIGRWGALQFSGNYTNMLDRQVQPQPGDAYLDLLRNPNAMWVYDSYAKVRADASVAWALQRWTTTLYANYIGHTPNYLAYAGNGYHYVHSSGARAGKWGSYTTFNLSVNYRALDNLTLSLIANNVFNRMPDGQARNYPGTSGVPYNNYLYNSYGRALFAQVKYDFGR